MAGGSFYLSPEEEASIAAWSAGEPGATAPSPAAAAAGGSTVGGVSTAQGSGLVEPTDDEEARQRAIAAHTSYLGADAANAANWNWQGNTQLDPVMDRSIRAQMEAARQAAVAATASGGTGMGAAAQVDPWADFKGIETQQSRRLGQEIERLNAELAKGSMSRYYQGGEYSTDAGSWRMDDLINDLGLSQGAFTNRVNGDPMEGGAGWSVGGLSTHNPTYEGQVFSQFVKAAGLSPEQAMPLWDQYIAEVGGIENLGLRDKLTVDRLIRDYGSQMSPEAIQWWETTGRAEQEARAQQWMDMTNAQRKASGGFMKYLAPLSVIAPFALGGLGAAGMLGSFGSGAGTALGAGVDAFGAAVPAGFAVAPAAGGTLAASALGGIGSLSDLWNAFSGLNPQEKMMLGNFAKMGTTALTGGEMDPMGFGLDMGLGISGVGGALSGMLSPALGNLGGQIGSNFLLSLGRGALSGGDMGDVLKNAAMGAGIGAAGSGIASAFSGGLPDFNFGGGESAPVPGYMSEMDLGGYNGGYVPADLPSDVNPVAPYNPAAEEDFSNLFSKESYMNQPGFNTATLDDLSAFTSPVQGMLGNLPQAAPEAPAQPQAQPPQQPSAAGRLAGAVTQQALGALRGLMGGDGGEARASGQAPRRQEGQSEQEYQGQVQQWAVNYLGLDAKTMADAGLTPGTPEYMDYIMQQADQIIADLGVDPEFLNGASVEQMQQQFRSMTQGQMNQLYRALTVRGQMDQSVNAQEGIDPFTGMREEFGGASAGNREIAAAQRGVARRADALAGLRGSDARDFLTGMLGTDVDLYGMKQSRRDRDELAAQAEEEERIREEDKRKRGRRQQRRVTQADLDQIFGVGY